MPSKPTKFGGRSDNQSQREFLKLLRPASIVAIVDGQRLPLRVRVPRSKCGPSYGFNK